MSALTTESDSKTSPKPKPGLPEGSDPYDVIRVRIDQCFVQSDVQRPVKDSHVEKIKSKFSYEKYGPLVGYRTEDGRYAIIVGQHHYLSGAALKPPSALIWIKVVHPESREHAAELGLEDNLSPDRPSPVSEWHSRVKMHDPRTIALNDVITDLGLSVGYAMKQIRAIREIERITDDRDLPEACLLLNRTLVALITAFPEQGEAYYSQMIRVFSWYMDEYPDLNPEEFGNRVGAPGLRHYASMVKDRSSVNMLSYAVKESFNKGKRDKNRIGLMQA